MQIEAKILTFLIDLQIGSFQSFLSLQAGSDSCAECCRGKTREERYCRYEQGKSFPVKGTSLSLLKGIIIESFYQEYYEPWGITYKGIQLVDVPQTNIAIYFNDVVDFIDVALETGGKVLVNCEMGMSRSSTCVLAYLMLRHQMSAGEALAKVKQKLTYLL